jgi:hypothetical protein
MDLPPRATLAVNAMKSVPTEEILASFQVSQAGDQFQVIDSDGSTYAGFLRPAPQPTAQPAAAAAERPRSVLANRVLPVKEAGGAMVADKPTAPQNPAYSFQVVGTNSMSRQRVVFTGNLTVNTNALSAMQAKFPGFRGGASQLQQNAPTPSELQNSRITGQAVLGDGRTIEINAAPVSP